MLQSHVRAMNRMPSFRSPKCWAGLRLVLGLTLTLLLQSEPAAAQAPGTVESRAFQRAMDAFTDGYYDRAERSFYQFITNFPASTLLAEATLLQAQSALNQTNAPRAISIITAALPKAGLLQDQYRYCLGSAYLENGSYSAAAEAFAGIPRAMTNSSLLLEAAYGEAQARFRLADYRAVVELLQNPDGPFQRSIRTRTADKFAIRGRLLLAESLFRLQQFRLAATALESLPATLLPEVHWERQYLLCRVLLAERRPVDALAATTNLVALATTTANRASIADSYSFQAGLLRQVGQFDEAAMAYTNNLAEGAPPEHRRQALLNIIELKLAQDKIPEAVAMLDSFLARHPEDAAAGVVLLSRGELDLKLHLATLATNRLRDDANVIEPGKPGFLTSALARFDALLATNTTGLLRGKALLNRGWALWLDGKASESSVAFTAALQALPHSVDQAIARFKLADAAFAQKDYTNALAHYRALTNDYATLPAVRETLFDQALSQTIRACIAIGDESGASRALSVLLESFPDSARADRGLFLIGQELLELGKPLRARERFLEFMSRFPHSLLRPAVELAIARTFVEERQWTNALAGYERWLEQYPTNTLRARAAFYHARTFYLAGQKTNALIHFTNFVATYQTDQQLAPMAQYWVAEYQLGLGHYREAIGGFQKILENTNWPTTNLTYEARFMAGLSAFSAQLWKDAAGHFTALIADDDNYPPNIAARAWFAYGDTLLNSPDLPQTKPIAKYKDAKEAFSRIPQRFTNSLLVAAAWGRVGDCHLQMASEDPKQYAEATNAYLRAMTNATADITVRSQAEFGLAQALELYGAKLTPAEKSGFQKAAFDHYYNVLLGENLREGEFPDPIWIRNAGFVAAKIAEDQKQWALAIAIYQRMHKVLEPLRPRLDERIRRVQELMRRELK